METAFLEKANAAPKIVQLEILPLALIRRILYASLLVDIQDMAHASFAL
jgi:hypothetical protein